MDDHGSSALVVEVPEAEPVVAEHRRHFDWSAALGVPAHVTVLYPFVAASAIDDRLLVTLTELFAHHPAFAYRFSRTACFGTEVLYLEPDDAAPFRALTDAAAAAFPEHPPYGGVHDEVIPHLTVADQADVDQMRNVAEAVTPELPVSGTAAAVTLLQRPAGAERWEIVTRFPLADGQTP